MKQRTISGAARRSGKSTAKRDFTQLRARLPWAFALGVAAYFSLTSSAAGVLVKADPQLAHALAPRNGAVSAALAAQRFSERPSPDAKSPAAQSANLAVMQDATAVEALTVLGFQAQLRGEEARSDQIFSLGTALSRRELRPQLWAIEEAVSRGDIAGALRHYDIALRTSADAQTMLFPILASALGEPRVRAALLPIMQSQPTWTASFLSHAADHGSDPRAVASFFGEVRSAKLPLPLDEVGHTNLVGGLIKAGHYDDAWRYYASFRPGADRGRSRDPGFALASEGRAPFDWVTTQDPALSASILQNAQGGVLDFAAPPSASGVLLQQLQLLPAGTYRLSGQSADIDQPIRSLPYWLLTCRDGRELGRVVVPNSAQANGLFTGRFVVPQGCPVQTLALVARPSDAISGVVGQIRSVQLARER